MKKDGTSTIWTSQTLQDPHRCDDKARRVQAMFNAIARRYEMANLVISFGQAPRWRKRLLQMIASHQVAIHRALDLCCGTGAMIPLVRRQYPDAEVLGADFAFNMLHFADYQFPRVSADALQLPFADGTFDLVTCTFGLRNFQSLETGLTEIHRILRPGGILAVLEFQIPPGLFGTLFHFYFDYILPPLGSLVTGAGRSGAYRYLPQSVKHWHDGNFLVELVQKTGLTLTQTDKLCCGTVWAVTATK